MNEAPAQRPKAIWRWVRIIVSLIACLLILAAAAIAIVVINRTEPVAQKVNASRKSSALVETVIVSRGTYSPRLVVLGAVQAAQDVVLSPRVSGQVLEMSPKLVPGGMIHKGDLLLQIDPADFENAVSISESQLAQREASYEIEQARQKLAAVELALLESTIEDANRALVMREPQIASIEAEVSAAKAAVARNKLDLARTSIYAPFDAQVLSRSVNIGSQVRPGDELSRLIGLDEYWIMASVPMRNIRWIDIPKAVTPQAGETESASADDSASSPPRGSKVILRNRDVWGPGVEREARVVRMMGALDSRTRLARVLISVDDPIGEKSGEPPLIIDTLIETEIEGRPITDVVRLQRDYVRENDTVWVMKDDKLEIRQTEVVFRDIQYAYIRSGIEAGEEVVTTTLATVAEGIGLRRKNAADAEQSPSDADKVEAHDDAASNGDGVAPIDAIPTDVAPTNEASNGAETLLPPANGEAAEATELTNEAVAE